MPRDDAPLLSRQVSSPAAASPRHTRSALFTYLRNAAESEAQQLLEVEDLLVCVDAQLAKAQNPRDRIRIMWRARNYADAFPGETNPVPVRWRQAHQGTHWVADQLPVAYLPSRATKGPRHEEVRALLEQLQYLLQLHVSLRGRLARHLAARQRVWRAAQPRLARIAGSTDGVRSLPESSETRFDCPDCQPSD